MSQTDLILYESLSDGVDRIEGFNSGSDVEGGDLIDLSDLFDGSIFTGDSVSDALAGGFLAVVPDGSDASTLQVDINGGADQWTSMVTIEGIVGASLLEDNILVA